MGCIWSNQERCMRCNRRAVNNLIIIDYVCEICIASATRRQNQSQSQTQVRPSFGEYRCSCGHTWSSRLCWPHGYQLCKRCKKPVYAHSRRELRPSDVKHGRENIQEHQKELCQMCQQLGHYCGNVKRSCKNKKKY